ncbi:hypothetical protein R5R35_011316 [Gryllus longicercus]|uniref:Chitin-binding type-2 domain-containing protein n=1 Tax=Gryllus longicercus TaxID=2509291 RepID=A0AAN9ZGE9_9ORTH
MFTAVPGATDDDGRQLQQWQIAVVVPPNQQGGGYPQGGYPPPQGGYLPQGGYPSQPGQGGYPQQPGQQPGQQLGGQQPADTSGQYPQQPGQGGQYPQQPGQGGQYPQQPGQGGQYPQQPGQGGQYPPQGGYPPQQGSYPPQQPPPGNIWIQVPIQGQGPSQPYPPQQPSYPPPQQPSYPPPQQPSYPPPQQPSYPPPQQPSYPPPQQPSYPPPEQPSYPPPPPPAEYPAPPSDNELPAGDSDSPSMAALRKMCKSPRGQFPSDNSCNRFVNCWDDTVVEQTCPSGLYFSDEKGYCDFPHNVECGQRSQDKPQPVSSECPTPYGTYRSNINCSAFVVCDGGRAINFNCPRGLDFNDELGVCDYPYRVECGGLASASSLPPEPENPEGGDGNYGGGDGGNGGNGDGGIAPAPAPAPGDGPGTMPPAEEPSGEARYDSSIYNAGTSCYHRKVYKLNKQCTSVSFCRRGYTNIISCPNGYAFDTYYGRCLPYGRARC